METSGAVGLKSEPWTPVFVDSSHFFIQNWWHLWKLYDLAWHYYIYGAIYKALQDIGPSQIHIPDESASTSASRLGCWMQMLWMFAVWRNGHAVIQWWLMAIWMISAVVCGWPWLVISCHWDKMSWLLILDHNNHHSYNQSQIGKIIHLIAWEKKPLKSNRLWKTILLKYYASLVYVGLRHHACHHSH